MWFADARLNLMETMGYCIFVDTLCSGMGPVWRDEAGKWIVYETEAQAAAEIEDDEREMLRQHLAVRHKDIGNT
jgi:hypothetical protein